MSHKFPDMEALANFAYTRLVIDEVLRLYPPGWLMTRRAIEDDYLGEYYVPAGTEVCISPYVIQRHPDLRLKTRVLPPRALQIFTDVREKRSAAMLPFSAEPEELHRRSHCSHRDASAPSNGRKPYPIGIRQTGSAGIRGGRKSAEQAQLHYVAGNEVYPLTCAGYGCGQPRVVLTESIRRKRRRYRGCLLYEV